MVAKSEASMPMSRALAKLAVATDLGTAARPSTAAPVSYPAASAGGVGNGVGSGSIIAAGGKAAFSTASGRSLLLKPSAARNVLASLPLPLSNSERQGKKAGAVAIGPVPPPATAVATAVPSAIISTVPSRAASGVILAAGPSTPRLPPLPSHSPPSPSPQSAMLAAAMAAASPSSVGAQLPPATPHAAQASTSPRNPLYAYPHPQQPLQNVALPTPPLPPCGFAHGSSSSSPGPGTSINDFSKELRDASRNHPGLAASLLAQLHHPRKGPSSAPFFGASSAPAAAAAAAAQPPPTSGGSSSSSVRPLSPRSRARFTASLVHRGAAAAAAAAAAVGETGSVAVAPLPPHQQLQLAAPSAAMASLSPEALTVLLGTPSSQPPSTAGGLLVMRRAGPASVGAGAALRPSTAQQSDGSGSTATGAAPGTSCSVSRPHVMPHITVPYKPGSIRLPPGGVPGLTAAVTLGGSSKGTSGPGSAVGSGTASPAAAPATAAATGAGILPRELLRPWTSAGASSVTLRPLTANPLTHCMPADTSAALVVRVPRSATDMLSIIAPPGNAARAPPSRAGSGGSYSAAARVATATALPGAAASAPGLQAERSGVAGDGGAQEARQLTEEELRAVVAALAAARPEAAALLLPRPSTSASAAAANDAAQGRPGTTSIRRPNTSAAGFPGNGPEAGAQGALWHSESLYSRPDGKPPTASSRTSSRATTRGSLLSGSAISMVLRDTSVYDDKWPRPTSSGSRPGSRGASTPGAADTASGAGAGDGGSGGNTGSNSRGGSSDSRRPAISAWGSTRRPLQPIPEDIELSSGEEASSSAAAAGSDVPNSLRPLEPLESDPELDAAWASIVAANQLPDTAAARAPSSGLNVFSRPPTGAIRITRQAAPMVLVLEDLTASTPEVLERELENLGLAELKAIQTKLCVSQLTGPSPTKEYAQ